MKFKLLSVLIPTRFRLFASRMTLDMISDRTTICKNNSVSKFLQIRNNIGSLEINVSASSNSIYGYLGLIDIVRE